jgi:hypothetical protein
MVPRQLFRQMKPNSGVHWESAASREKKFRAKRISMRKRTAFNLMMEKSGKDYGSDASLSSPGKEDGTQPHMTQSHIRSE